MKTTKCFFLFALFSLLIALFIACGDGSGGGGGGVPPTSISYTGKKGGDTYTLTITQSAAKAAYQPVTDDDYTLTLSSSGETYTSDGTVIVVDGQTFTLIPLNGTGSATVTVSGNSITEISGEGFDWNNDISFNTPGILDRSSEVYQGDIVLKGVMGQSIINIAGTGEITLDTGAGDFYFEKLAGEDQYINFRFGWPTWETRTVSITQGNVTALDCHNMGITELIFNDAPNLKWLVCSENHLKYLDVSENAPNLEYLDCNINELEELIVSGMPLLTLLNCYNNKLRQLNIRQCDSLEVLECNVNSLWKIEIDESNSLHTIRCSQNDLDMYALIAMFNPLLDFTVVTHIVDNVNVGGSLWCALNPGYSDFKGYIFDGTNNQGQGFRKGWWID